MNGKIKIRETNELSGINSSGSWGLLWLKPLSLLELLILDHQTTGTRVVTINGSIETFYYSFSLSILFTILLSILTSLHLSFYLSLHLSIRTSILTSVYHYIYPYLWELHLMSYNDSKRKDNLYGVGLSPFCPHRDSLFIVWQAIESSSRRKDIL